MVTASLACIAASSHVACSSRNCTLYLDPLRAKGGGGAQSLPEILRQLSLVTHNPGLLARRIYNNILEAPSRLRLGNSIDSSDAEEDQTEAGSCQSTGVPVYVMLPLDTVWLIEREGRMFSVSTGADVHTLGTCYTHETCPNHCLIYGQ